MTGGVGLAGLLWREAQRGIDRLRDRTAELEAEMKLRRETEYKLRHSQKLEAVGQLSDGIAHDFNNNLTIILGNLDTLRRRLSNPSPLQLSQESASGLPKLVGMAQQEAKSAAHLTHRLLLSPGWAA